MDEPTEDPLAGKKLDDRYTLIERIGAGSMGTVYRSRQHATARDVAIKILRRERAVDAGSKARFLREARANSLLTSPNTVTVFDFGHAKGGELFLAMELLEGESLGERLQRRKRLTPQEAVDMARGVLNSLAEAHAKGLIHRDLKPDNIFFSKIVGSEREVVKVLDFGIAKFMTTDGPMNAVETQAGTVFGTPRYMSPEQAKGERLDGRSDLYSLGVILYHAIVGHPPFTDDDAVIVMARHIKTAPRALSVEVPELHPQLERVVLRALEKNAEARYFHAEEMSNALAEVERNGWFLRAENIPLSTGAHAPVESSAVLPTEKRRWTNIAAIALVPLLLIGVGIWKTRSTTTSQPPAGDPTAIPSTPSVVKTTTATSEATEVKSAAPLPSATESTVDVASLAKNRPSASGKKHPAQPKPSASEATGYGILEDK